MSNLVVPNVGKVNLALRRSGEEAAIPATIHLFKNQYQPVAGTGVGDFVECNFGGYSLKLMENPVTDPDVNAANASVTSWDEQTWTKAGGAANDVWGYYVLDTDTNLLWAEKFDGPVSMAVDGASLSLTPRFTGKSEFGNAA